ncbi:hypothetical protein VP01_4482g1 [Puccinia sorghi]|uniref:Uncharacterized protein n=1 Tax=Puccinia sorghi TaxID=27349 RepID=A0A0L6URA3_9BASI|nr:hypothetical protein VP01_4482g1 [Puccinia sorghi]
MEDQSQQDFYQTSQIWSKGHGYALIITHSSTSKTYQCEKSGSSHTQKKGLDKELLG